MTGLGTIINGASIVAGGLVGHFAGKLIHEEQQDSLTKACGVSGNILGVNAFNQPGVEAYKKNMFALLGKPGYEKEGEAIRARLAK